jgi:hypothetical protein
MSTGGQGAYYTELQLLLDETDMETADGSFIELGVVWTATEEDEVAAGTARGAAELPRLPFDSDTMIQQVLSTHKVILFKPRPTQHD